MQANKSDSDCINRTIFPEPSTRLIIVVSRVQVPLPLQLVSVLLEFLSVSSSAWLFPPRNPAFSISRRGRSRGERVIYRGRCSDASGVLGHVDVLCEARIPMA